MAEYYIVLKSGAWRRGDKSYTGKMVVSEKEAKHFIGCRLVDASNHPDFTGETIGPPQRMSKEEEARGKFGNGTFKSLQTFANRHGYKIDWLISIGAEEWFPVSEDE